MINICLFLLSCTLIIAVSQAAAKQGESFLTSWVALLGVLANFFVLKQITLFGFHATASDVFAVGCLWSLNLMQEHFGAKAAKRAIWASFLALGFFVLGSQIHLAYVPSELDTAQSAYETLLAPTPRLLLGSLVAFFVSQQCDRWLYQHSQQWLSVVPPIRSSLTLILSQALDTILFGMIALYGVLSGLSEILLVSYGIKCVAILAMLPSALIAHKRFLSHAN